MSQLSIVVSLFLIRWLVPILLTTHEPIGPPGMNPFHGLDDKDTEQFAAILNLVRSGAYKIEEVSIRGEGQNADTTKLYHILLTKKDSIFVEIYIIQNGKSYQSQKAIYSNNGVPLCFIEAHE